jgi:hypothetical protein
MQCQIGQHRRRKRPPASEVAPSFSLLEFTDRQITKTLSRYTLVGDLQTWEIFSSSEIKATLALISLEQMNLYQMADKAASCQDEEGHFVTFSLIWPYCNFTQNKLGSY